MLMYSAVTVLAAASLLAPTASASNTQLAFASPSFHSSSTSTSHVVPLPSSLLQSKSRHHATSSSSSSLSATSSGRSRSFESLGLSDELVTVAQKMKWDIPTPVQQLSIPAILDMAERTDNDDEDNSSLWCEGPTGSGKTGGFALPLLQILMQQKRFDYGTYEGIPGQGKVNTLIICPTRELAAQTGSVLQKLISSLPKRKGSRNAAISVDVIHGGVPVEPQVARLARKRKMGETIDILVATPGRLVGVLKYEERVEDPTMKALERRIMDAFDEKTMAKRGKGKRGGGRRGGGDDSSLSLNEIQEMDLDRMDDDGRASLNEMLQQLDYLVLDEADRLLGGAFKDEMDQLLSLFPNPNKEGESTEGTGLKTLLFSATFPEEIEEKVDGVLSRMSVGTPLRVSTSAAMLQRAPTTDEDGDDSNTEQLSNRQKKHMANTTPIMNVLPDTAPKIQHRIIRLDERDRTQALRYLLEENDENEWDRVLVFVATRYATEHVSRKLRRYDIAAADLHGKLDQDARERRLKSFQSGKTRVLISTDLAARGIDVEGLPVVVHYDLPRGAADFTHRTGRTGRAGKEGTAISFVSAKSEAHFNFIESKELMHEQQRIEREVIEKFAPDEAAWEIKSAASTISVPGAAHSQKGLAHDRVFGGVKGRGRSKKDKLREAAAKAAAKSAQKK